MNPLRRSATVSLVLAGLMLASCTGGNEPATRTPATTTPVANSSKPTASAKPTSFVCPPGSTPGRTGPAKEARPTYFRAAMDAGSGKIVAVETTGTGTTGRTWTLDVCTNTWRMMRPPREPDLNWWMPLVYDADAHLIVGISRDGFVWTYSVEGNTWTPRPWSGGSLPPMLWHATYEPSSGNVIARDPASGDLWSYSVGASEWTRFGKPGPINGYGYGDLMTYDTALRRLVLVLMPGLQSMPSQVWTFEPTSGSWTRQQAVPPQFETGEIAYDQSAQRIVVFGNGVLATYDATKDRWATVPLPRSLSHPLTGAGPLARINLTMVYDPVNERIVVLGGEVLTSPSQATWQPVDDVWAYKVASNTWTKLVPSRH